MAEVKPVYGKPALEGISIELTIPEAIFVRGLLGLSTQIDANKIADAHGVCAPDSYSVYQAINRILEGHGYENKTTDVEYLLF